MGCVGRCMVVRGTQSHPCTPHPLPERWPTGTLWSRVAGELAESQEHENVVRHLEELTGLFISMSHNRHAIGHASYMEPVGTLLSILLCASTGSS